MLNIKGLVERGESYYNPFLNDVVEELERQGLAVKSEGATAVFLDGVSQIFEQVFTLFWTFLIRILI